MYRKSSIWARDALSKKLFYQKLCAVANISDNIFIIELNKFTYNHKITKERIIKQQQLNCLIKMNENGPSSGKLMMDVGRIPSIVLRVPPSHFCTFAGFYANEPGRDTAESHGGFVGAATLPMNLVALASHNGE